MFSKTEEGPAIAPSLPEVDHLPEPQVDASGTDLVHGDIETPLDQYGKLYEYQHWRDYTERFLADTSYGYHSHTPPLTQEQFRELPSEIFHAVAGAIAGGLKGEKIALECSAFLCAHAPDDHTRTFLATQVADEARHVEVFSKRLYRMGFTDLEATMKKYVGERMYDFHEHMRQRVCETRDFVGGVIGQNLALEGLALGFFEFYASLLRDIDPGTSQILDTVLQDERRHVGFGLVNLRGFMEKEPDKAVYVHDTLSVLSQEMVGIFDENAKNMGELGVNANEAMKRVKHYHRSHLKRLGLDATGI
jgi:ribonucleotide reductase beta subunit family protein with ferritin-like domain